MSASVSVFPVRGERSAGGMPLDRQKASTGGGVDRDHGGVVLTAENSVRDWPVVT